MPISVILRFRTAENLLPMYDQVVSEMGLRDGAAPKGAIYHFAARTPEGLLTADVWETRESFEQFTHGQFFPSTQKHGLPVPEIDYGEIAHVIDGGMSSKSGLALLATFEGDADEICRLIKEVDEKTGSIKNPPAGLVYHAATKRPNGVRIVDHWCSREEFDRFISDTLAPALYLAGADTLPDPQLEFYTIHNTIDARRVRT